MVQSDLSRMLDLLRDHPISGEVLELTFSTVRATPGSDEIVGRLEEIAQNTGLIGPQFLLAEALHRAGRFAEAGEALRSARTIGGAAALHELCRQFPPRYTERLRFYGMNRSLGGIETKEVLEIGGTLPRSFLEPAAPAGWTCVDLLIEEAATNGFYRLVPGDAAELPLADESVDLVFSSSAFEHISNLGAALAEMARVLRPGGAVYADFSPIWSSAHGHHLRGRAREVLRAAQLWPPPAWFHLTMSRREMREFLGKHLTAEDQRIVERWLYRRPSINRLFYEDFVHLFHVSPLRVRRVDPKIGETPDEATLELLRRRQPGRSNFHVTGFRVALSK